MDEACRYRIRVKGVLAHDWSAWFDGFTITRIDDDSLLTGMVRDQAELNGLINKIQSLGLFLLLVEWLEAAPAIQTGELK